MLNGFTLSPLPAAVVLGVYAVIIVYALIAPSRGPDPQRGVAVGCLLIVLAALLAAGALLATAVRMKWDWLVTAISGACLYSIIIVIPGLIKSVFDKIKKRP
jgi:peptidoglycan biosynthesis protein MviN/MurJ (putative lipid II flippase)